MRLIFDNPEAIAHWVGEKCGKPFPIAHAAIGVVDHNNEPIGGFVFTNYTGDSVEISLAGRGAFARGAWRGVVDYVFRQLGCSRMQMHTAATNKFMRRRAPKAGFIFEGKARRLYGKTDGYTYSLTVDDLPAFMRRWRM